MESLTRIFRRARDLPPLMRASAVDTQFLGGGGDINALIAAFDWSATPLGPISGWPPAMQTVIAMILRSPVAMLTAWGEPGVVIYNQAYAGFAAERHPALLGTCLRDGTLPDQRQFAELIMSSVRAGRTLSYRDHEFNVQRGGKMEKIWVDLDYSPLPDAAGKPAGLLSVVHDTTAKVLAERWLKSETERLRQMFAQAPGFMVLLRGPSQVIELVNGAFTTLVGIADLVGKPAREALPDLEGQGLFHLLEQAFATGEMVNGRAARLLVARPRGPENKFIDFAAQPMRDPEGEIAGIFIQGMDVTARVQAEAAVRESDVQFQIVAQTMPNHVWTSRPDGYLDWFNDRVYEYSGAALGSIDGENWGLLVHAEDLPRAVEVWGAALASGDPYEVEFRVRQHDGAYRWHIARALPLRDLSGAIQRWIGTNTDIHERKLTEAVNTAERERIWNSTNDLMGTGGIDGFLKNVNPAWSRLLGFSEPELLARPFIERIDPRDHPRLAEAMAMLASGKPVELEDRLIHRDGSLSTIAWRAEASGQVFHMVGRNVTGQRAAEEALRQSQKMEAVGQLTGGIAHDFNNLLQGITGSLDLLQKRIDQGRMGELDRFIVGAMGAANRASALTHRLLAFSRRQPLDPRAMKANPLISSMEDLLRRTMGESIDLELVLAGGLWLTLCDPNQLENAVLNLAINARDAMPDGGKLTIETCNAHLDNSYAANQRDVRPGQYICICVTDTGTGMSADTISKAFEPFFTTKPIGQGTGLGLSMIYGFARQSEGYAKIYSELGAGTTVKIYLPRLRAAEEAAGPVPEITELHAAAPGETVLVVEDEPVVRGLIVEVLGDLGYRALEAADGPAGLEILNSGRRVDLLVTDIGLPGLNGRQMAEAARLSRPELKVLFMTGYAENAALASGFLEPGMAMMTKPFAMEALATRIRGMIENK